MQPSDLRFVYDCKCLFSSPALHVSPYLLGYRVKCVCNGTDATASKPPRIGAVQQPARYQPPLREAAGFGFPGRAAPADPSEAPLANSRFL
mmetsp:Transcript_6597/g.19893  ORF Transcript_6597/g.19893 Transcript_6597/m.19893 type:complete len:91 (+) Transcript_6597:291-563(+)